jgi:hypothetical protein
MATDSTISIKELKDCLDALEKLKGIRTELKGKLSKQGLSDDEEVKFAENLRKTSEQIRHLEEVKLRGLNIPQGGEVMATPKAKKKA